VRKMQSPAFGKDHYGQRLIGCIDCNRWSWEGSKHLFMELVEEDLLALRDGLIRR
jgi:hypothetical protein